jgi:YVTN family beta-propeller protein
MPTAALAVLLMSQPLLPRQWVFVTNERGGTITVIDAATARVERTLKLGGRLRGSTRARAPRFSRGTARGRM